MKRRHIALAELELRKILRAPVDLRGDGADGARDPLRRLFRFLRAHRFEARFALLTRALRQMHRKQNVVLPRDAAWPERESVFWCRVTFVIALPTLSVSKAPSLASLLIGSSGDSIVISSSTFVCCTGVISGTDQTLPPADFGMTSLAAARPSQSQA